MSMGHSLGIIILSAVAIFFAGKYFASASSRLGKYLRLPASVKAATFDAVSSSLPELLVALFSVIAFGKFEVGIGAITGSAFFNILVIPGICVLVSPVVFKLNKDVLSRDALFYFVTVILMLSILLATKNWGYAVAILLLGTYAIYIAIISKDTKKYQKKENPKKEIINLKKELLIALGTLVVIGFASFFLTQEAIRFAEAVGISPLIIGFTIVASATSFPDAVISIVNAKKGLPDDAISNVFGSNNFNILFGLGLPLLIATIISGPTTIVFDHIEIIIGLLLTTIITYYFMANDKKISKTEGIILLLLFCIFIAYVIFLSLAG
ncbi:sodium:calcium antiporter [Candidatus Woesearchaeota archaeon]|nr:sodium:calcium antiporter [Candidatus Woesearchaeota archaeon]